MGDPRKQRKKFSGPQHPWNKARIDEEKILLAEYGLKNKRELWKMSSKLAKFRKQAKELTVRTDVQGEKEKHLFTEKLGKLKLLSNEATIDDVLGLTVKDLLERRLQTILFRKGLCRSIKQSRQFIVHEHVYVNGQKMDVPSYLVPVMFEESIEFDPKSTLSDPEHPERKIIEKAPEVEEGSEDEEVTKEKEEVKEEKVVEEKKEEVVEKKVESTEAVKEEAPKEVTA